MLLSQLIPIIFFGLYVIILARVIFSWIPVSSRSPALGKLRRFSYEVTEPMLRPIRRALAPYQGRTGIDFSPLILFVILSVVERLIMRLLWV